MMKPTVVVVGSLHHDIMVDAPDRPMKGETVTGHAWHRKFGGKGGNQAVAAARAGADVRMWGAVGDDDFGRFMTQTLSGAGVDATHVRVIPGAETGMSVAISDSAGDYGAVIVSGANLLADPATLDDPALWSGAAALILQNEMPEQVNIAAAQMARKAGLLVCLNAAPYRPLTAELEALVDLLVVNAIEAEQMGGGPVTDLATAAAAARTLAHRHARVVVTAGEFGVAGIEAGGEAVMRPALPVRLVSTHGAGDVFVGSLVVAILEGQDYSAALGLANSAAAEHVSDPARH